MTKERVLVIRLGALGDLVLCAQAFASVRRHHPDAEIALLTMPGFVSYAKSMPWFDRVITDPRPPAWNVLAWIKLIRDVRAFAPTRVYDFQGKPRQSILFWALGGPVAGPAWSGAATGCSMPRFWPPQPDMHYTDFVAAQLREAQVPLVQDVERDWLSGGATDVLAGLELPSRFALLIPGCAPNRLYKRWPPEHYADLANRLAARGIQSVVIGTKAEADAADRIAALSPAVLNLCGKTSLYQVGAIARRAVCVVGNDTGPTHIAAAVGAKTLALMSDRVNPVWSSPKGAQSRWLQGKPIEALTVDEVEAACL